MPKSTIALTPIESSKIHAIGYDAARQTCAVQFKNKSGPSAVYEYPNFSPEKFERFRNAESPGRFFNQEIQGDANHPHVKMVDEEAEKEVA